MRVKPPKFPSRPYMPGHELVWRCEYPYAVLPVVGGEDHPPQTSRQ